MNWIEIIKWLSPVGLVFDIIGAIIIFKFGLPKEISRSGSISLVLEKEDEDEKALAKKYDNYSKYGFYLLILGFILQFISSITGIYNN
jgi:hypothetical protein